MRGPAKNSRQFRPVSPLIYPLAKQPWIVPIAGTTKLAHREENLRAVAIDLTSDNLREIDSAVSKITVQSVRYPNLLRK